MARLLLTLLLGLLGGGSDPRNPVGKAEVLRQP